MDRFAGEAVRAFHDRCVGGRIHAPQPISVQYLLNAERSSVSIVRLGSPVPMLSSFSLQRRATSPRSPHR